MAIEFATGQRLTADLLNTNVVTPVNETTAEKPVGRIRQGTAQTGIVNSTATAITFAATDEIDTAGFHSTSTNNTRVTPTVAGLYRASGGVSLAGATDFTVVQAYIALNGTPMAPAHRITPSASSQTLVLPVSAFVACDGVSDYFEIFYTATRSGAGTSSTAVSVQFASVLEWEFIRPL
jgi:hypothetical protein